MKTESCCGRRGTRQSGLRGFHWLENCAGESSSHWKRYGIAFAAALAAAAGTARADGGQSIEDLKKLSPAELMAVDVQMVTTASKKAEKETAAPATTIVITAADIRLRGYSTLADVLRDQPGMETIPYYFSEIGTLVPVRGIPGNNKIVVLVNGMRVNPPGGENFPLRSDFSVRGAERIEIIYGPGSTLYGQDAISCVINVITKKSTEDGAAEVGGSGGLNSERETWGTFGGALDEAGNLRLSGYVQYHDSDLTRLDKEYPDWWKQYRELSEPRGEGVIPVRQDFGLNIFARVDIFEETSVQFWNRQSRRSSSEGGYPPAYVSEAIWEDESTVVEARNTHKFGESLKLDSAAGYNHYEISPDSRYVFNTPTLTNSWFLNDYKYGIGESYTWEETLRAQITEDISLLGGGMAGTYNIVPKSTIPGGADTERGLDSQGGAFEYSSPDDPGTMHRIPRVQRSKYQTYAAYLEGDWRVFDKLKLIGGTRVTKDTRFDDTPFTPRAAAIFDITEQLTAKYIYTRAYVAPAPYFANAVYDNGSLLATSNPDLKPEKAETHEVNLTFNRKNLSLGASGFHGKQTDIITLSDQAMTENIVAETVYLNGDPDQPRKLVQTANGGESTSHGGEVYGRATIGDVSPWFSYSFAEVDQDNGAAISGLSGISAHNGRLGATWAVTKKLFVTPSFVIRSTPENVNGGILEDEMQTPWQVDLYALYNASKRVDVFLDIRNLTDHHYALGGISGQAVPQETLHGQIGLRASF